MIIRETNTNQFETRLSKNELTLLHNALNEVCNGIDSFEFSTRLGIQREAALEMLSQISRTLEAADSSS